MVFGCRESLLVKAMILAAGEGRRMRPLTDKLPKPLIRVGGQPLIERHLIRLRESGFTEIVVNVSYLGEQLEQFLGNGEEWDLKIIVSREPEPLETAGGIKRALPLLGDEPFLVVSGDIYTEFDFAHIRNTVLGENLAHLVLVENPPHHRAGDFGLEGERVVAESAGIILADPVKQANPNFTYAGIGVYCRSFFDSCNLAKIPLKPLMLSAANSKKLTGEFFAGFWTDVGTPDRLKALNECLDMRPVER